MPELVDFLTAQLDMDETIALAAIADDCDQDGGFEDAHWLSNGTRLPRFGEAAGDLIRTYAVPRRVLREVAAKRRVIALHCPRQPGRYDRTDVHECAGCGVEGPNDWAITDDIDECPYLRNLASIYEGAPGWQERWRV